MMLSKRNIKIISFLLLCFVFNKNFSMNVLNFYDTLILPEIREDSRFQIYGQFQTGFGCSKGFNCAGFPVNVLQIYDCDQNALKMLEGFDSNCPIGQLRERIDAADNCIRGHLSVCGDLKMNAALELAWWYHFKENFSLSFHLPIFSMKLCNVCWQDHTRDITAEDLRVKEYLTNNLCRVTRELGCLDIGNWCRSGAGDALALFRWMRDFEQAKYILKNVRLNARLGVTLPTGRRRNEDKIFAFPFGNDGATGALAGVGIDLTLGHNVKTGLDVQLLHVFGNTRCRRIKTHPCQTEFLLLQKANVFREFGITQRFNLYLEAFQRGGISFRAGYQFVRHGDDYLFISSNRFSDTIANTAKSLCEWTAHSLIFNLGYNFLRTNADDERRVHPYVALFAKIPFNGVQVATTKTIGVTLSIDW